MIGLGSKVAGFAVGDAVLGWSMGDAYADTIGVPAGQCVEKPARMPWAEAGALSASGQTASTALDALELGAGETVIIHAAAGGVGSMAVQIAAAKGATVIGTASPGNHSYLAVARRQACRLSRRLSPTRYARRRRTAPTRR